MKKTLIALNVVSLLVVLLVGVWVSTTHTDVSATKNRHLHYRLIEEIKEEKDIEVVRGKYIKQLNINSSTRREHNFESKLSIYPIAIVVLLNFISIVIAVKLKRS